MAPEVAEKSCIGIAGEEKICNGEKGEEKLCNKEPDALEKVQIQEAMNAKSDKPQKVELTAEEHEAISRHVPKYIRTQFAAKIWALLALQMLTAFIISIVVEAVVHKPAKTMHRFLYWVGSSFIAFIFLSLLRKYQQKFPLNYMCLLLAIFATGFFWGMTKFIVENFFNHNVCGIIMGSLVLSAVCFLCGFTARLAACLEPKYSRELAKEIRRRKTIRENCLKDLVWEEEKDAKTGAEGVIDQLTTVKDHEIEQIRKANDGVLRAGMLIGIFTWAIASAICYLVTHVMIKLAEDDDWMFQEHWRKNAKYPSALMGAFFAFPMLLFFHFDIDRQMRKCREDQAMKAIININSDIAICFIIVYALCAILACNQGSLDMQNDDIGGGDMDVAVGGDGDGGGGGVSASVPDVDGAVAADTTV